MQPLVGVEELGERSAPLQRQVGFSGKQGILPPLDKRPVLRSQPLVLLFPHRIEGLLQMSHHMKLVIQDGGLGRMLYRRALEGPPHVHDRELNARRLLGL